MDANASTASSGGSQHHPHWWLNLQVNQSALIQVGNKKSYVRARNTQGNQRSQLWNRFKEMEKSYKRYEQLSPRTIPVIELIPEESPINSQKTRK